jgi:hypothetical protein
MFFLQSGLKASNRRRAREWSRLEFRVQPSLLDSIFLPAIFLPNPYSPMFEKIDLNRRRKTQALPGSKKTTVDGIYLCRLKKRVC